MRFNKIYSILFFISLMTIPNTLQAKNDGLLIEEIKRGGPISRVHPKYPVSAARRGQEGWVVMSFVVDKTGKVNSTIVEDSSNGKVFNKAATKAIEQWVYKPTTINGKAVEQCKNTIRFDFMLDTEEQGARKKFARSYKKITKLITEKKFDEAEESINTLKNKGVWNLYEDAWINSLSASLYSETGDEIKELAALTSVSRSNKSYFDNETNLNHLTRLFDLHIDHKLYVEALETAKKVKKLDKAKKVYFKLEKVVGQLEKFINSGGDYVVKGNTSKKGIWSYGLARKSFGFTGQTSHLRKLDVRCDNKHSVYSIAKDSIWTIPSSWGKCRVFVYGDNNSVVNLVEVKNKI